VNFPEPKEMMSSSLVDKLDGGDEALIVASLIAEPDVNASVTAMLLGLKRAAHGASSYVVSLVMRSADVSGVLSKVGATPYALLALDGPVSQSFSLQRHSLVACDVNVRQEATFCDVVLTFECNT